MRGRRSLSMLRFATYLSRVVRAIVDVIVGQGEGVETSCRCPGCLVVWRWERVSEKSLDRSLKRSKSLRQYLSPGYQKSTVKSLVVALVVGGASSLLKQYPLVWPAKADLH